MLPRSAWGITPALWRNDPGRFAGISVALLGSVDPALIPVPTYVMGPIQTACGPDTVNRCGRTLSATGAARGRTWSPGTGARRGLGAFMGRPFSLQCTRRRAGAARRSSDGRSGPGGRRTRAGSARVVAVGAGRGGWAPPSPCVIPASRDVEHLTHLRDGDGEAVGLDAPESYFPSCVQRRIALFRTAFPSRPSRFARSRSRTRWSSART